MLAYISSFNEWKKIYEKKKEEFEKYVSKNPKRSREELAAEASKVLLDEVLKRYDIAEFFPEIKPVISLMGSKPANEVGGLIGDFVKFYFQKNSVDNSGRQRSGEEVVKDFAYKCVKKFLLKRMLGD